MASPIPGMDPWLEDSELFGDFHATLITYLKESLNAVLPPGYRAITNLLVWVDDETRREPDVSVFGNGYQPSNGGTAVAEVAGMLALGRALTPDPPEVPYLEIQSSRGKRLVTAVEILSPANKRRGEAGHTAYLAKQHEFQLGGVNILEFDLLRAGAHTTAVPLDLLRRRAGPYDYHISLMTPGDRPDYFAALLKLGLRLPAIGVPLDPGMAAVVIDLQPLVDRAYATGRYGEAVDYTQPPRPPLTPEQAAAVQPFLGAGAT